MDVSVVIGHLRESHHDNYLLTSSSDGQSDLAKALPLTEDPNLRVPAYRNHKQGFHVSGPFAAFPIAGLAVMFS